MVKNTSGLILSNYPFKAITSGSESALYPLKVSESGVPYGAQ